MILAKATLVAEFYGKGKRTSLFMKLMVRRLFIRTTMKSSLSGI